MRPVALRMSLGTPRAFSQFLRRLWSEEQGSEDMLFAVLIAVVLSIVLLIVGCQAFNFMIDRAFHAQ